MKNYPAAHFFLVLLLFASVFSFRFAVFLIRVCTLIRLLFLFPVRLLVSFSLLFLYLVRYFERLTAESSRLGTEYRVSRGDSRKIPLS